MNKELLYELKALLMDTHCSNNPNISFRGFLLGNYTRACIESSFPNLQKYIDLEFHEDGGK